MSEFYCFLGRKEKNLNQINCYGESRLERIGNIFTRKSEVDGFNKALSEIILQAEADYLAMEENEQKIKQILGSYMKCMQQATLTCKQNLKALNDVKSFYIEMSNKIEADHQEEIKKLKNMLENYMDQFKKETQRKSMEDLCHYILQNLKE